MKNKYVVILALFLICNSVKAQSVTFRESYSFGFIDIPANIVQNPAKNYVFSTSGPFSAEITELDTFGNRISSFNYSNAQIGDIKNVSGGYIVTGSTSQSLLIMKLDLAYNITWQKSYRIGSSSEFGNRIVPTSDGGYVVAGSIRRVTPPAGTQKDSSNCFALKVDGLGTLQWGKVFFMTNAYDNDHALYDVAEVNDGYIFAGTMEIAAGDPATNNSLLIKTNLAGTFQWAKRYGIGSANAIVPLSGTEVMVTGEDNNRTYYLKVTSAGVSNGGNQYQFPGTFGLGVGTPQKGFVANDGNYAFIGTYINPLAFIIGNDYLMKVNSTNGNVMFSRTFGGGTFSASIIATGGQTADSGYIWLGTGLDTSSAVFGGGFPAGITKTDKNGNMNNLNCDSVAITNPTRSGYTPTFTNVANIEIGGIVTSTPSSVRTSVTPIQVVKCIKVSCTPPTTPTASASPNPVCFGTGTTLTASGSGSNVTYKWYAGPSGGAVLSTGATYNVTPTATTTYYVDATNNSLPGCISARGSVSVTVNNPPANIDTIVGVAAPCPGVQNYSIATVSGATGYSWAISGGGTIIDSTTGTQITVDWTTSGGPYTVNVSATNSCGTKTKSRTVNVQTGPPGTVGAITGNINPCPGNENYSITAVTGAATYNWTLSGGGSITGGQGTNSITINWATSGGPHTISVAATNGCGSSPGTTQVTVQDGPPGAVGTITGSTGPCPGSEAYNILTVAGATGYVWSVSGGGSIASGQGSSQVSINWTTAGGPYTVSVVASNNCGSTSGLVQVTVLDGAPGAIGAITGNTTPCVDTASYSISPVAGVSSYTWVVTSGGTISSGQGSTEILVNWTVPGGQQTVSVTATNSCGNASNALVVNVQNPPPAAPAAIIGDTNVCIGNSAYSVTAVQFATTYTWTVSGTAGGTITSGQGTANININYATAGTDTITVTASNSCGTSSATTLIVGVISAQPTGLGTITGTSPVCHGTQVYTVGAAANAQSYNWVVGAPGSILSGQGTTSINVNWPATAGTFPVSVTANNVCGASQTATFSVTVLDNAPVAPSAITGNNNPCPGTAAYNIQPINGVSVYTWTVSAGGTITSGQGTTSISVDWTTPGGPYTVSVTADNVCGSSIPATLLVNVQNGTSPVAGNILGDTSICPSAQAYSIATVPGATGYNWTVSGGGTISSGQGTNAIGINFTTPGGPYTVSVIVTGSCSNSAPVNLDVTVRPGIPSTPGAITGGLSNPCGSQNQTYTIALTPNATNYTWTLSGGGTIVSGQGTNSVDVSWGATSGTDTLYVVATNSCGSSAASILVVTILPPAPVLSSVIVGDTGVCPGTETYTVTAATNATSHTWVVSPGGTILSGQGTTSISVSWTVAGAQTVSVTASNTCGTSTAATLNVNVYPSPTQPTVTARDTTICQGNSATLAASGSTGGTVNYNFYDAITGGAPHPSPYTVTPPVTTTYYLETVNNFGCSYGTGRMPVTVNVLTSPTVLEIVAQDGALCYGSSTVLTASASPANSTITWWDSPGGGTQIATGATYTTPGLTQSTTYYVQVEANGCQSISVRTPVTVTVLNLVEVTLTSDKENNTIFPDEVIIFTAHPPGLSSYEFFVNGSSVQSGADSTYSSSKLSDKDTVSVIGTLNGCSSDIDSGVVYVVDFPNVFTPNGDNVNDRFLKDYDLTVLNRWGQELYKGMDGWDGQYNGMKVSPGTYFYIVTLDNITDRKTTIKGTVLLIQD